MFQCIDKLQVDLPAPGRRDPNAALQELLGGKSGEMSTLGNYMFQIFNFRSKAKLRPFDSLVASISAEELGHVELVSNGVSMPMNSNGASRNMDFVTTTGNVILDLLHNFHLECGARQHKLRVHETMTEATGREVCGYLLVRASVHAHAYALALKQLTGVDIEKMRPTLNINLNAIPESPKSLAEGSHCRPYTFSPADYREMAGIWGNGERALPGHPPGELEVVQGMPQGGKINDLTGTPSAFTADYAPEEMFEVAKKPYMKSR